MHQIFFYQVSDIQFYAYNLLCIVGLIWLLRKYYGNSVFALFIVCFFSGIADDLGGNIGRNIYRIGLLGICAWMSSKGAFMEFANRFPKVLLALLTYSLYFAIDSIVINHDNALLVFSLLSKIWTPYLIIGLIFERQEIDKNTANDIFWLLGDIIIVQIFLSIGKLIILGGFLEGWVGSMTGIRGGGAGTSFPLLCLMWLALKTDMEFTKKDWLIAAGLLLLGFATGKRAVWILFPVLFVILMTYVYRREILKKILLILIFSPILFYFAVRISPTFNPDKKVWGRFDPEYTVSFVLKYSAGVDEYNSDVKSGTGRLGAVDWMLSRFSEKGQDVLLGKGNEFFTYASIDNYSNASYYEGITSRGSITGIVSTFFTLGIIGVVLSLALWTIFFLPYRTRFNICLTGVVLIDYIFYNAQIVTMIPLLLFSLYLSFLNPYLSDEEESEFNPTI